MFAIVLFGYSWELITSHSYYLIRGIDKRCQDIDFQPLTFPKFYILHSKSVVTSLISARWRCIKFYGRATQLRILIMRFRCRWVLIGDAFILKFKHFTFINIGLLWSFVLSLFSSVIFWSLCKKSWFHFISW